MKKKVLVIYARYGAGHKSMAEYVAKYLKERNHKIEVMLFDMTEYGNTLGKMGIKLWKWVGSHRHEKLFDVIYELMNNKIATLPNNITAKKSYDNLELRKIICEFNPDITISTHFFCSNMITYYNKLGIIKSKLFTIITDYRSHEFWIRNKNDEDGYIVGNKVVKEELIQKGIKASKIYDFGLPLNISVLNNLDTKDEIYQKYSLPHNKPIYLFFGGSALGNMYYYDYFKVIAKLNLQAYIIFISGKNTQLKEKCQQYVEKHHLKNILVLGFSNDVLNLMKVSDLVISKPGGATVTECMEMRVPMLLVPGLGGQEKYNAKFMVRKKYGIRVKGLRTFKKWLLKLNNNPNIIKKMQEQLSKLDNNKSVEKINNLINHI